MSFRSGSRLAALYSCNERAGSARVYLFLSLYNELLSLSINKVGIYAAMCRRVLGLWYPSIFIRKYPDRNISVPRDVLQPLYAHLPGAFCQSRGNPAAGWQPEGMQ